MKKVLFSFFSMLLVSTMATAQYCTTSAASSTADEEITNVSFTSTLNNSTNCANPLTGTQGVGTGAPGFVNFTAGIAPTVVFPGVSYPFSVTIASCGTFNFNSGCKIYIDYNQDGDFVDAGEEVYYSGVGNAVNCVPPQTLTGNITIPITAVPGITRMRVIDVEGGQFAATTITPCGVYTWGETEDYALQIIPPIPCSAIPQISAGVIVAPDTITVCPSATTQLCIDSSSLYSGINYEWLTSTNNGATWTTIPGATSLCYTVPAGTPSALYKFAALCTFTFSMDTTDAVYINVIDPLYTTVPYTQSFENWIDYCTTKDVPDNFWSNTPSTGDPSWRRNDEGATASWSNVTSGAYTPPSSDLAHSARFHAYSSNFSGFFDLHVNMASAPGVKTLYFDYKIATFGPNFSVELDTTGSGTFFPLLVYNNIANWQTAFLNIASNSPTCRIRFKGNSSLFNGDIGLDNIKIYGPCSGTPNAGTMVDTNVCAADTFALVTLGTTGASGLSYQWQSAPAANGPFTNIAVTSLNKTNTAITTPTYFRCIVTCTSSNQSDTTNVMFAGINTFYYCYCKNTTTSTFDAFDIGNVKLTKLTGTMLDTLIYNVDIPSTDTFNNTTAINGYTSYQNSLPIRKIYRDSLYKISITDITQFSWNPFGATKVLLDFNRNGIFEFYETIGGGSINSANSTVVDFYVPDSSNLGITGLRIITADNSPYTSIPDCGNIFSGEVEDYLVEIIVPPCAKPTNPGIAYITDSVMCPGYVTVLFDTNHTKLNNFSGLTMNWEISTNNGASYTDIAGATSDSLIYVVNQNSKFRLKLICGSIGTGDTVYSNVKDVTMLPSYACYPASASLGGNKDTADNGYFTLGIYSYSSAGSTGPHLGNPAAVRTRTDFTPSGPMTLYTDSTYGISFYNILKPYNHADAQITMFIDYNNNGVYDIPAEKVFTGISTSTSFYLPGVFTTPQFPALDVATGCRIVLNNNTSISNPASNLGVGLYTSGETEDFLVKFKSKPNAIQDIVNVGNVEVYPNPTTGLVYVDMDANKLDELNILVTNIVGAEVYSNTYKNINGKFSTSIQLGHLPKGNYTMKLSSEKGSVIRKITLN